VALSQATAEQLSGQGSVREQPGQVQMVCMSKMMGHSTRRDGLQSLRFHRHRVPLRQDTQEKGTRPYAERSRAWGRVSSASRRHAHKRLECGCARVAKLADARDLKSGQSERTETQGRASLWKQTTSWWDFVHHGAPT